MTGVIGGSGGTGVLEGSRPGTGVEGGGGALVPMSLGSWTQDDTGFGSLSTFVTPSVTARPGEALYIVFVQSTNRNDTFANIVSLTGMGLTWEEMVNDYYDSSTAGVDRSAQACFTARGVATDGPLTVTMGSVLARAAVAAIVIDGVPGQVGFTFTSNAGVGPIEVGPVADLPISTVLLGANCIFDASTNPPVFDPAWDAFDFSGYGYRQQGVQAGWVANDVDTTLTMTNSTATNQGAIILGVTASIPNYASKLNQIDAGGNTVEARYPGQIKGTSPNIDGYETEIVKAEYEVDARYPGYVKGTSPGDAPGNYDALVETGLDTSFYAPGASKGAGSNPVNYDTLVELDPDTTFYTPDASTFTGHDPDAYDTVIASLTQARWVPGDSIVAAAELPAYDTEIASLTRALWYPLDATAVPADPLAVAIMALLPSGYWVLDVVSGTTAEDISGNSHDGTFSGDYTLASETGPGLAKFAHFQSDFIGPGHGARVTVPTTALDGSFSAETHGLTVVALVKRDSPVDLGYPFVKRTDAVTDWEYDMSYTSGEYRTESYDSASVALGGTIIPLPNSIDWELLVFRVPTIAAASAPWDIFVDGSLPTVPTTADAGAAGYAASDSPLGIGGFPDTDSYGHNGAMAHVAFFDGELTEAQIQTIVDAAVAAGWITAPALETAIMGFAPAGYWKLDDAGSTFVDSSGNGNNGTGTAVTSRGATAPDGLGYALFVTGSDSVVTIPNPGANMSLPTDPGLSIVALVRPDTLAASRSIISRGYQTPYTNGEWAAQLGVSTDVIDVRKANADLSNVRSTTTSATMVAGEWRQVVITFEDGTTTGPIKVYANGYEIGGLNTAGTGASAALAGDLRIGGRPDASLSWDGAIAHVAVIPGVLTLADVENLASAAAADGWIERLGLEAAILGLAPASYLKFDEASGDAIDYGSRGVNATPSGSLTYQGQAGPDGVDYVAMSSGQFSLVDAADLSIDAATGKTFCIAFRPTSVANYWALIGKLTATGSGVGIRDYGVFSPASLDRVSGYWFQQDSTSSFYREDSADAVTLNQWNFLIVRYNVDGTVDLFVDSATQTGVYGAGPDGTRATSGSAPLVIGNLGSYAYPLVGAMAHFAMWNTALDDTAIGALVTSAITEGWVP